MQQNSPTCHLHTSLLGQCASVSLFLPNNSCHYGQRVPLQFNQNTGHSLSPGVFAFLTCNLAFLCFYWRNSFLLLSGPSANFSTGHVSLNNTTFFLASVTIFTKSLAFMWSICTLWTKPQSPLGDKTVSFLTSMMVGHSHHVFTH